MKLSREHTDNGEDRAINLQVRLREVLWRPEVLPPVSVADQNGGAGPFFRIARAKITTDDRLNAEDLEKVGGDVCDRRARGLRSARNGRDVVVVFSNRAKAVVLIAKVVEVRVRKARPTALRANLEDRHDPACMGVRQRSEERRVGKECR